MVNTSSLSKVMLSIARCAFNKIVPPGVSYTPLDLIPTYLFSTISTLPIPLAAPNLLSFSKRLKGESFFPLMAIGSPFLN